MLGLFYCLKACDCYLIGNRKRVCIQIIEVVRRHNGKLSIITTRKRWPWPPFQLAPATKSRKAVKAPTTVDRPGDNTIVQWYLKKYIVLYNSGIHGSNSANEQFIIG